MARSITASVRWFMIILLSAILLSMVWGCGGGFIDPTFQDENEQEQQEDEEDPNSTDDSGGITTATVIAPAAALLG